MSYINEDFSLKLDNIHYIYCWIAGNKNGISILYVHERFRSNGNNECLKYFDLDKFYVILFEQRVCDKSYSSISIENNNTKNLVTGIQMLRKYLNINKWIIFAGSWGSSLSLIYSIYYPKTIKRLILKGIFTWAKRWLMLIIWS